MGGNDKPVVIRQPKPSKKDELPNQQREALPPPPLTALADPTRLVAYTAPLSAEGLLSHQTREAVRWVLGQAHGGQVVHLRAYVAGTGDLRRVPELVAELCAERHTPLPTLTVVLAGALAQSNAQILLQAIVQQSRSVNPEGIAYAVASADTLAAAYAKVSLQGTPLQTTCYVPSIEGLAPIEGVDLVQPQRFSRRTAVSCEALLRAPGATQPVLFTSAQLAFGESDEASQLAVGRLDRALAAANSSLHNAIQARAYPLSLPAARAAQRALAAAGVAASRQDVLFEALPSLDGAWAFDAVATVNPTSNPVR
jgi:hypothetical protein